MITTLSNFNNRHDKLIKRNKSNIWNSSEIIQMRKVIELVKNWNDGMLNKIIARYFKLKYWKETTTENFGKFIIFLVKSIKYHIFCMKNFPAQGRPSKEELKMARKVTEFERGFHEILYYWQVDIFPEVSRQVDEILARVIWF